MADGSRHALYSVAESIYGVTPNDPAFDTVRITGTTLALTKDSLTSEEIRSDRQISHICHGANQVGGDINFELSYDSFDDFFKAVLMSPAWASPADTGVTTISATATGFSRVTGSFLTDGFKVGQSVLSSGFTGLGFNGTSVVTDVQEFTLDATPLTGAHGVEAGGGDEQVIASEAIYSEVTRQSFTMVRNFDDILMANNPYHIFRGVELNTVSLTIAANAKITGSFSVIGQSLELAQDLTGLGTPTIEPPTCQNTPINSFKGVLEEGGQLIAVVTEITLSLENGIAPRFVVGSTNTILPSIENSNLSGNLTAYFEDSLLLNKFINEEESSLVLILEDIDGNILRYIIPRIKYMGGQVDVGGTGPISINMPFQAILDCGGTETNFLIERIPNV